MIKKSERNATPIYKRIIRIFLTIIAILLQISLYMIVFFDYAKYQVIEIVVRIIGLIMVLDIYRSEANSSYKLSWTIFILLIPFAGPVLFFVYGKGHTLPKRKYKKITGYIKDKIPEDQTIDTLAGLYHKLSLLLKNDTDLNVYQNTETKFLTDGSVKFDCLLEEVDKATKYIFLEYFIISSGYAWNTLRDLLIKKAKQGVIIRIIYDDIGSKSVLDKRDIRLMNHTENIMMVAYNPLGVNFSLSLNYRDHRKICVIDGNVAFVGGINLADEYIHKKEKFGYWRDNAMYFRGDAVSGFVILFCKMWFLSTVEVLNPIDFYGTKQNVSEEGYVFPFGDGPTILANPAYNLFETMINNAQKYIYISTPYFIIDKDFLMNIVRAIKSGVDVRILMPHIPDKKTVFLMSRAHYGEILKAGGHIYEFTPGFNHAKNVICDDSFAFIGTVNMDYRSLFLHFECGSLIMGKATIIDMKEDFLRALTDSEEITYSKWKKRSLFIKFIEHILYILSPLM